MARKLPECENDRCVSGFVEVIRTPFDETIPDPDGSKRLAHIAEQNTVYPCKVCQPQMFFRWMRGHLDSDHDRRNCSECGEIPGTSRRRGRPRHDSGQVQSGPVTTTAEF